MRCPRSTGRPPVRSRCPESVSEVSSSIPPQGCLTGREGDRCPVVGTGSLAAAVAVLTVGIAGCSNVVIKNGTGKGAPGVSSTEIDVGSIANVSGPLSSDFAPLVNGVEAYFSMVNSQGVWPGASSS